tara:strand:- start:51 stop:644 length:594 start_codon:yes stop_codon:yes gene_type:complete
MSFGTSTDKIELFTIEIIKEAIEIINEDISNLNLKLSLNSLNVFEIGSNTGLLSLLLSKYFNSWFGIERHKPFLKILNEQKNGQFHKLKFKKGWIDEDIPVSSNSQTFIICNNIMKYTDNIEKYFTILEDFLIKNGLLLIIEHNAHNFLSTKKLVNINKEKIDKLEKYFKKQEIFDSLFYKKYNTSNFYFFKSKKIR